MATVYIPTHLRKLMDGHAQIEVSAITVQGMLAELAAAYPRARGVLFKDSAGVGEISRFIGVFVDGQDYRDLGGGACPLTAATRIDLLLPLAGG